LLGIFFYPVGMDGIFKQKIYMRTVSISDSPASKMNHFIRDILSVYSCKSIISHHGILLDSDSPNVISQFFTSANFKICLETASLLLSGPFCEIRRTV
jgi:hypothetical protein